MTKPEPVEEPPFIDEALVEEVLAGWREHCDYHFWRPQRWCGYCRAREDHDQA